MQCMQPQTCIASLLHTFNDVGYPNIFLGVYGSKYTQIALKNIYYVE